MARDVAELIMSDHRRVEELFQQLEGGAGGRRALVDQVIDELTAHAVAEEQIVYPAIRDVVPGGSAMADEAQSDHEAMKQAIGTLQSLDPGDAKFDRTLKRLIAEVREHVPGEENQLLPALRQVIGQDKMEELCSLFEQVKGTVPTGG